MLVLLFTLFACEEAPTPGQIIQEGCRADGNPQACFTIGSNQLNSPRPNYSIAREKFATGCTVHHPPSCNALGTLVRDARGGPKNLVRAIELFTVACDQGLAQACVNLAGVLTIDDGSITPDPKRAAALYASACGGEEKIPMACTKLGEMMLSAPGAKAPDKKEAGELFEEACKAGHAPACVDRANMLLPKWGKSNVSEAVEFYDRACELDANFGCYELGGLHATKRAPEANFEQAARYYGAACRNQTSHGCFELAELMTKGSVPSRPGEKEALYKLACESGNSEACSKR